MEGTCEQKKKEEKGLVHATHCDGPHQQVIIIIDSHIVNR